MELSSVTFLEKKKNSKRFLILVSTVSISGFTQGLLLPLLAVLLERNGISSSLNGLSASALYLGILLASPLMEQPVRRFGYKSVIISGITLIIFSILMFSLWYNYIFWLVLRFLVGIGDAALHYASQVWITSTVDAEKRGRSISLYGFSYGIGFAIGPLGLLLLPYGEWVPFMVALILLLVILIPILSLKNEKPDNSSLQKNEKRYLMVYALAGLALLPFFLYGILEATLNSNFPIYGLRKGISEANVSLLLSTFVIGSLVFQLPLGIISDYFGRSKVLIVTTLIGGLLLLLVPTANSIISLYIIFALAGSLVGSLFSLGLAYVADLIPPNLLPTANVIAGIHFGLGSIIGPFVAGIAINEVSPNALFYFIGILILSFSILEMLRSLLPYLKK